MNAKSVRDILATLDGKVFESKEAVEDAVFPMWAKLSTVFHGEGHRDLVDRLINARWLEVVQGKWKFFLPAEEKFNPAPTPEKKDNAPSITTSSSQAEIAFATELELTVEDVTLMNHVPKGVTMTPALQNLINAGLVAQTFALTEKGHRALDFASRQTLKFKI